jgi:GT2 family glycosyltransferase
VPESSTALAPIDIIIPFYSNPELVESVFASIHCVLSELIALDCRLIAVNDSPGHVALARALEVAHQSVTSLIPMVLIENERNLGFVQSVNRALSLSMRDEHDVLLLNSDAALFPGAVTEIQTVAYIDPMVGFVSPRSNNATICSLPATRETSGLSPDECWQNFLALSGFLPRWHFAPTAVGFCLFIKRRIIEEFGVFDEVYGGGYNEENDLIMRANRCGYRAALANHAFVYHRGEASFNISAAPKEGREARNAEILSQRYPEYVNHCNRYLLGPHSQAESLLTPFIPFRDGRQNVVFDFSSVGSYHAGTFEAAKEILRLAPYRWRDRFHVFVMVSDEAYRFHKLDSVRGVYPVPVDTSQTFSAAFRFGQPFEMEHVARLSRVAPVNIFGMLDPIAWDCLYLQRPDLDRLWQFTFSYADAIVYISDFVKQQFNRRFTVRPGMRELVSYLSLSFSDYSGANHNAPSDGGYYLIFGNSFHHKRLAFAVEHLGHELPKERFVVVGSRAFSGRNIVSYESGNLSETQIENLYSGARAVIYPSTYEGFGLPIVKGLAMRKPVYARDMAVTTELVEKLPPTRNLRLFTSTRELARQLKADPAGWIDDLRPDAPNSKHDWGASVDEIGRLIEEAIRGLEFSRTLVPRIEALDLLRAAEKAVPARPPGHAGPADHSRIQELERELNERSMTLDAHRQTIVDQAAQVRDLRNSYSWRITAPLRRLADIIQPRRQP